MTATTELQRWSHKTGLPMILGWVDGRQGYLRCYECAYGIETKPLTVGSAGTDDTHCDKCGMLLVPVEPEA